MLPEKEDNICPGCQEEVREVYLKHHIQNCRKYPVTILRDVSRLEKDNHAPKNLLKV
jgi:hypothetical protein